MAMRRRRGKPSPRQADATPLLASHGGGAAERSLGETCEALLASGPWNAAHTTTHGGLVERLKMIEDAGLPRMRVRSPRDQHHHHRRHYHHHHHRKPQPKTTTTAAYRYLQSPPSPPHSQLGLQVLSNRKLKELGRIPRSHEGHQEDALAAVERCGADGNNQPKAVIFFYSHRWARGNWCEELQRELPWGSEEYKRAVAEGKLVGDPDDAAHSKARALAAYGEWFREGMVKDAFPGSVDRDLARGDDVEIFWWIDWCCTDQVSRGTTEGAPPGSSAFSLRARTRVPCRREGASGRRQRAGAFRTAAASAASPSPHRCRPTHPRPLPAPVSVPVHTAPPSSKLAPRSDPTPTRFSSARAAPGQAAPQEVHQRAGPGRAAGHCGAARLRRRERRHRRGVDARVRVPPVVPRGAAAGVRLHDRGRTRAGGARGLRRRVGAGHGGGEDRAGRPARDCGHADEPERPAGDRVADGGGGALDGLLVLAYVRQQLDDERDSFLPFERLLLLPVVRSQASSRRVARGVRAGYQRSK